MKSCVKLGFAPFSERNNRDKTLIASLLFEFDHTVLEGVQRVVLTHTNILAGVVGRTALTDDDVAGQSRLTAVNLYAESFAF